MIVNQVAAQMCEFDRTVSRTRSRSIAYAQFAEEDLVPHVGEACLEVVFTFKDGHETLARHAFKMEDISQATEQDIRAAIMRDVEDPEMLRKVSITQLVHPEDSYVVPWLNQDHFPPSREYFF
eukprot:EC120631.1.p2 GENE.EC120631.1~~EC120631.1.p2  ORF type:complete len:123 (+),score=20.62 EC120631.1:137-505(+)